MLFGKDPRQKAVLDMALEQVEKVLRQMQKDGKDLAGLKIKRYQKTHYTSCTCAQCLAAKRSKDPHQRGLLEDGFKLYTGMGDQEPDA